MPDKLTLLDLGEDIILFHIVSHLTYHDTRALQRAANGTFASSFFDNSYFYKLLFEKRFRGSNAASLATLAGVSSNWRQLYRLRKHSRLHTWGKNVQGRLGYRVADAPPGNVSEINGKKYVVRPTEVAALVGEQKGTVLEDVSAGGYGFQVLSGAGNVFTVGHHAAFRERPAPMAEGDYNRLFELNPELLYDAPVVGLAGGPSVGQFHILSTDQEGSNLKKQKKEHLRGAGDDGATVAAREKKYVESRTDFIFGRSLPPAESTRDLKIVSLSSGKLHFLALDSHNQVWSWEQKEQLYGVKLKFVDGATRQDIRADPEVNVITKVLAGHNLSACFVYGIGIVVWNSRDPLRKENNLDDAVNTHFKILDMSRGHDTVADFFLGEDFLLYVTESGLLYKLDFHSETLDDFRGGRAYSVLSFNYHLDTLRSSNSTAAPKFVKVVGNKQRFAVFTNRDTVLLGTRDAVSQSHFGSTGAYPASAKPVIHKELQGQHCIDMQMGDHHTLALLATGDLYAFGTEKHACGALGLGSYDDIVERYGAEVVKFDERAWESDLEVVRPVKVELGDKVALAIATTGLQSAAILGPKSG